MALKLIKGHGRDAMVVAAQWVRCADRAGDPDRHTAWLQIESLVHKLINSADITKKLRAKVDKARQAANPLDQPNLTPQPEPPRPSLPAE
jgi:hypothetical protein